MKRKEIRYIKMFKQQMLMNYKASIKKMKTQIKSYKK